MYKIFSAMSRNAVQTANNARNDGIELPILMYHGILKDTKLQGDYVISPYQFEQDLKMLREKGCHTVTVSNLTDYVYSDKPLPENPVMLTFDDGYYNNYLYAYPLLKKYECSAVISPIAYYSELYSNSDEKQGASYAHCTWQQLAEMQESGLVEVQNHSYNMHSLSGRKGIQQKQGEGSDEYKLAVKDDILKSQDMLHEKLGTYPQAFVYPFGAYNSVAEELMKVSGDFESSDFVRETTGADNVCERSAVMCSGGKLVIRKTAADGVTVAAAEKPVFLDFERKTL